MRIEGTYRSIGFSAREHVRDQLLDFWDTSGSTDKNDLVNRALVDLGVAEDLLDGIHGGAEEVLAKLLEPGTRWWFVRRRTGFALPARRRFGDDEEHGRSRRGLHEVELISLSDGKVLTLLVLPLELLHEVVDESIVEILSSQVGVTGSRLDLEDTLLNGKERDIESTTTEIEDEYVLLASTLLVESVSDGGSGGFIDDSQNVESGDHTSILGSLSLRIVEIGGDGNDGLGDGSAEIGFRGLLHLNENHGRNLFRRLVRSQQGRPKRNEKKSTNCLSSPRYST